MGIFNAIFRPNYTIFQFGEGLLSHDFVGIGLREFVFDIDMTSMRYFSLLMENAKGDENGITRLIILFKVAEMR